MINLDETACGAALARLFDLAEGYGGGAARARSFLCAWFNGSELGGFDLADLWSLDVEHREAMIVVFAWIARAPQGTYADAIEGFGERMRALAERRWRARHPDDHADDDGNLLAEVHGADPLGDV
jgi:hypothetical protein